MRARAAQACSESALSVSPSGTRDARLPGSAVSIAAGNGCGGVRLTIVVGPNGATTEAAAAAAEEELLLLLLLLLLLSSSESPSLLSMIKMADSSSSPARLPWVCCGGRLKFAAASSLILFAEGEDIISFRFVSFRFVGV